MKNMIYLIRLLTRFVFLFLLSGSAFAGGLSAWEQHTPGGNTLQYDGTSAHTAFLYLEHCGDSLRDELTLQQWYFYKQHIIGKNGDSLYYVIDEGRCVVNRFTSEAAFKQYIAEHRLKPALWLRSYDTMRTWDYFEQLCFMAFMLFPLTIILLILYLVVGVGLLLGKKKAVWKTVLLVVVPAGVIITALLQYFPQSW